MLSATRHQRPCRQHKRQQQEGRPIQGTQTLVHAHWSPCGQLHFPGLFITNLLIFTLLASYGNAWPLDYRWLYPQCPGPEWSSLCRGCCEYELIRCKCPLQGAPVGYAVPCCRNAINECDPCIIHPGCSIFDNCKRCHNGTLAPRDDFFIRGQYCSECRPGWSGGDCRKCGGVIKKRQGHIVLEAYPTNARCEWTLQVERPLTIELSFMMLSLEFDHSCRYDFVEVRDGDNMNSRVIGRFCGNERPPPIQSSGNQLHILFVSDGYKNFDGFFAIFQENSACSSSPCLHDGTCVLDSSKSYHCACLAGYTGRRCENVLMCGRPMMPLYGGAQSLNLNVGGHVIYRCQPGYKLQGLRIATCRLDGSWSSPAPQCVPTNERNCVPPPKPIYGDHFLVYGQGDVVIALQYLCYRPYRLIGTQQRACLPNGTWSGIEPSCVKVARPVPVPDKDKDGDTSQDKHPSGKDTKDIDDSTNMVKEKDAEKERNKENKGLDQDIQVIVFKDPGQDMKNLSVDTGGVPGTGVDKDKHVEDINIVKEKGPDPEIDSEKSKDKELDNDLSVKDLHPNLTKNTTKAADDGTNTVEEKDLEKDKDVGGGQDKSSPKDGEGDLGRDIDIILLPEGGKNSEDKDIIHTEYRVGKDELAHHAPVTPDVAIDTLHPKKSHNATDPIGSNEIESMGENAHPREGKQVPDARNATWQGTAAGGTGKEVPGADKDGKGRGDKEGGISTDHEQQPRKNATTSGTEAAERATTDIPRSSETGPDNQSIPGHEKRKCPPPPRLYHGFHRSVPGLSPETLEFSCNHSYALSGSARHSCLPDGSWNGTMPICVRACREPKVSMLVKQTVLPPNIPSRKTPVHKFYSSSSFSSRASSLLPSPTRSPAVGAQLPPGFHPLYTHIQYECLSPFYQHTGSARRTCLKTGKWSGRHVSCSPVCGKIPSFDPRAPSEIHWPWLVAIYRRTTQSPAAKVGMASGKAGKAGASMEDMTGSEGWQLVCSGALVNQRSVVVAAHCVTELGKVYSLDAAKMKVVLGKTYRSDQRQTKGLQHLRVASIVVHPNYDPLVLDADVAMIKLLDKARIGEHVLPICLPERSAALVVEPGKEEEEAAAAAEDEEQTRVKQAVVTGWTLVANDDRDRHLRGDVPGRRDDDEDEEQQQAAEDERARVGRVQLARDAVQCERQYARNGMPISITENMFCGRQQQPDKGPTRICPADTGGILLLPAPTPAPAPSPVPGADSSILLQEEEEEVSRQRVWRLLGLVSFGYDHPECNPQLYTVYTRVANFLDFIESHMK